MRRTPRRTKRNHSLPEKCPARHDPTPYVVEAACNCIQEDWSDVEETSIASSLCVAAVVEGV